MSFSATYTLVDRLFLAGRDTIDLVQRRERHTPSFYFRNWLHTRGLEGRFRTTPQTDRRAFGSLLVM